MTRLRDPGVLMDSAASRILIVEDHEDTREFLGVVLAQSKYELETASTFFEGLRLANGHAFDLFIFDSMLPDGSGVELCRLVRGFNQKTPIIFCSPSSGFQLSEAQAV